MDKPLFSVIIPVLNEEKYLPRLLRCLVKQAFRDFEVIVVDGGSTDQTITKTQGFTQSVPALRILHSPKKNVSFQRNMGAGTATGTYLVFFDADVQLRPRFLEQVAKSIRIHKYMFLTTWMRPDSREPRDYLIVTINNMLLEGAKLLDNPFAGGWNIIIHKSVFDQISGFDPEIVISEDHDFTRRCLKAGVILTILKHPRIIYSLRRFRRYGYWTMLRLYAHTSLYGLLKKPITKAIFDYPMGGAIYKGTKVVPEGGFAKFERTLLQSMRKFLSAQQ